MSEDEIQEDGRKIGLAGLFGAMTGAFIFGLMFLCVGYLPIAFDNDSYTIGHCVGTPGKVEDGYCPSADCKGCFVRCWIAYIGYSAVPNVTSYQLFGKFATEAVALNATREGVGKDYGPCYYKDGGTVIRMQLTEVRGWIIVFSVMFGMSGCIALFLTTVFVCVLRRERRLKQQQQREEQARAKEKAKPRKHQQDQRPLLYQESGGAKAVDDFDGVVIEM